jgi:excisionase family DNA binding protein
MNKEEAARHLGISVRSLERYTQQDRVAVRYERGKTRPSPVYDQVDLDRFKAELERPVYKAVGEIAPDNDSVFDGQNGTTNLARVERALLTTTPENLAESGDIEGALLAEISPHIQSLIGATAIITARHVASEVARVLAESGEIQRPALLESSDTTANGESKLLPDNDSPARLRQPSPSLAELSSKLLLTVPEVCALTGLSRGTVAAAVKAGELAAKQIGRSRRVKRTDLEEWVKGL